MAGEAQRTVNVIKTLIDSETGGAAKMNFTPGVVSSAYGSGYLASVYVRADEYMEDIDIPLGMNVNAGSYVMVAETGSGEAWIDYVLPQDDYSKLAIDFESREFLVGDGTTAPTASAYFDASGALHGSAINTLVTQAKTATLEAIYPVGSLYSSKNSSMPADIAALGTWARYGEGKFFVGQDSGDTDFDNIADTGGAKTHTHGYTTVIAHTHNLSSHVHAGPSHQHDLQNHYHTTTITMQSHQHLLRGSNAGGSQTMLNRYGSRSGNANTGNTTPYDGGGGWYNQNSGGPSSNVTSWSGTGNTGGPSNNTSGSTGSASGTTDSGSTLPPYAVIYTWERTA